MMLELMELMVETCSLVWSLEERLELALLLAETELRAPYELSDSVPAMKRDLSCEVREVERRDE